MPAPTLTTQPHNLEAEKTVLGCVILDPDAMARIRPRLSANDFHDPIHRTIYKTCEKLFDDRKPIDYVTIAGALESNDRIVELGGSAFLAELAAAVPTSSHIEQYAATVREKSGIRSLLKAATSIISEGMESEARYSDVISNAQTQLLKIGAKEFTQSKQSLAEVASIIYDKSTDAQAGGDAFEKGRFFTGYSNIDSFFDGLEPDTFNLIAARPSMGKTALMLNMAMNAAVKDKKHVLFLSLEMSNEQLVSRILSSKLRVSMTQVRRGKLTDKEFHSMGDIASAFADVSFYLEDTVSTTVPEILAKALQHKAEHGLDVLFIDYLQLLGASSSSAKGASRVERYTDISRELKVLARALQVPVIVASQLSRECEKRVDKRPLVSDLRESGGLEQDGDNILMLYRDDYYYDDSETPGITNVFIRKNRQGSVGVADLMFKAETTQFVPVDYQHEEGELVG